MHNMTQMYNTIIRQLPYQICVGDIRVAIRVGSVDSQRYAVGEDCHQN